MGKLQDDIQEVIAYSEGRGLDELKVAKRLIEAGAALMIESEQGSFASTIFARDGKVPFYAVIGEKGIISYQFGFSSPDLQSKMHTTLRKAGETFDRYARNHFAKSPPQIEKAEANVEAASECFAAIGQAYMPPEPTQNVDFRPAQSDSGSEAPRTAYLDTTALLRAILVTREEPPRGVDVHLDDQGLLLALVQLGYVLRDELSDLLTVTTKGKEFLGIRPEGVPDLPVEVASITGNIEERELAARYIDEKIKGVENWIAKNAGDPNVRDYDIMSRVLTETAHEFRSGMHLPALVIEGKIISYNESRDTGMRHADNLRAFYTDVHERNVKAGWWTDLETGEPKLRNFGELLMLFVTEIWEAYTAYRDRAADDKLPQYPGEGVELGDLEIRLADLCGALLAGRIPVHSDVSNPGEDMLREIGVIAERYESIRKTPQAVGEKELGEAMLPMDVATMVDAKLEFNASRADHKIENRVKDGGKKT